MILSLLHPAFKLFLVLMVLWFIGSTLALVYVEMGKEGFKKLAYRVKKVFKYLSSKTEATVYFEDNNATIIVKFLWATYKVIYNKETKLFNVFVGKKKENDEWLEWVNLGEPRSVKQVESFFNILIANYGGREFLLKNNDEDGKKE